MKIGFSTSVIQRGQTGIGRYVVALLQAMLAEARGHEFTLFVLKEDLPLFDFAVKQTEIVSVPETTRPAVKNILWHQRVLPALARRHGLDVLHVPSYRRLIWQQPCALVATIHDLAPFRLPQKYDWARMFYGRTVVRQIAKRQHEVIAVSQQTARDIQEYFRLPAERVTVIHNGLDHARFSPGSRREAKALVARRHGLNQPFFLYTARLEHPAKNHVRLITAFNQFRRRTGMPWHLVLGGGDWHGAEAIHAAVRASPFAGDIHALGFIPDDELPTWYRAADVFVYPSLFEGFGLPPIEAMACGCPVIASTRGALGEVCGSASVTVDPEDVSDLELQLTRLASEPALRERLQKVGIIHARGFDWQFAAAATLAVYERAHQQARIRRADSRVLEHRALNVEP